MERRLKWFKSKKSRDRRSIKRRQYGKSRSKKSKKLSSKIYGKNPHKGFKSSKMGCVRNVLNTYEFHNLLDNYKLKNTEVYTVSRKKVGGESRTLLIQFVKSHDEAKKLKKLNEYLKKNNITGDNSAVGSCGVGKGLVLYTEYEKMSLGFFTKEPCEKLERLVFFSQAYAHQHLIMDTIHYNNIGIKHKYLHSESKLYLLGLRGEKSKKKKIEIYYENLRVVVKFLFKIANDKRKIYNCKPHKMDKVVKKILDEKPEKSVLVYLNNVKDKLYISKAVKNLIVKSFSMYSKKLSRQTLMKLKSE